MEYDFKKWVKGDTPEENKRLSEVDAEFGKLLEKLETKNVERESVFIYGMFNLLEYLHLKNDDLFHRLRVLLESYIIFIRMRTKYKEHPIPPADIKMTTLGNDHDVTVTCVMDYMSDGSAECYSLISTLSDYIQTLINEKYKFQKDVRIIETKH